MRSPKSGELSLQTSMDERYLPLQAWSADLWGAIGEKGSTVQRLRLHMNTMCSLNVNGTNLESSSQSEYSVVGFLGRQSFQGEQDSIRLLRN